MKYYRVLLLILIFCLMAIFVSAQDKTNEEGIYSCYQDKSEKSALIEKAESEHFNVRRVNFSGNPTTRDWETRKRMELHEGDIFTKTLLEKSIKNLSQSKYFYPVSLENVEVRLHEKSRDIDMIFCMQERQKDEIDKEKINPCFQEEDEKIKLMEEAELSQYRIRHISILGNTYTRDITFRKEFASDEPFVFDEGYIFRQESLEKTLDGINEIKTIFPIRLDDVKVWLGKREIDDKAFNVINFDFCIEQKPKN